MKTRKRRQKCLHCKELFLPDYRSGPRQQFCSRSECRKASRRHSQAGWLAKAANKEYFRDPAHAARVRQWQKDHPGYWKNTTRYRGRTLQDTCSEQVFADEQVTSGLDPRTLQDLCSLQLPMFVGLISMLTGSTLQEDIATTGRRLVATGHTILGMPPGWNLERSSDEKTCPQCGALAQSPGPV